MALLQNVFFKVLLHVGIKESTKPCGKCGINVLDICDFRFTIIERDSNTNQKISRYKNIPVYCPCIIGMFSEKEINTRITKRIVFLSIMNFDEMKIREVLNRYIHIIDYDVITNELQNKNKYKNTINKMKRFIEIYEEFTNLKPAKR
jgi:hypothetical protein